MSSPPQRGVIALLTAQAVAFGVMLALVVVPANAIFLDAYGATWLPATYIAIAVVGTAASALIARAARRTRLVRVATVSLTSVAVLYAAAWLILLAGGVWVSAGLLVLFPIALQIGFVFIGAQAGRLLDVRQMKERFARVVTGFSVGFLLGGLLAIPLLALLGSTEDLLIGTTLAQLVFVGLLLATERRFPEVHAAPAGTGRETARPAGRALFASRLVLLLLVYQVLSAMGSWLVDYLLFNRAHEHYTGDDLTRFLSWYTAALNLVDILFLALLAGPLMRRFGLRLGLVLNPAVDLRVPGGDRRRRRRARACGIRPVRARGGRAPVRHRPHRRHHPHVRQCVVPDGPDQGPSGRAGGRGGHRRSRCDRRHGSGAPPHERDRPRVSGR